ncbi:MAG TPA: hypothetical protein VE954_24500 [Oligoflexus sp.]|uniref:DUF6929 family protein n=1 Tax=Oligoflexus sp. TaxID=1971216 RepID=UPI002D3B37D2|nr:hypothetical protein [Oligoflexus sp.]HYX36277.1 hypothetical protein [Oligoflexus sp.]
MNISLELKRLRQLDLEPNLNEKRRPYLSSASGLVQAHGRLYVVSDDEISLGVFPLTMGQPGFLLPIWEGRLPEKKDERKKLKPDLESLVLLDTKMWASGGSLLVIPSGSKPNRQEGALLHFSESGLLQGKPQPIHFSPLYQHLQKQFPDLNIEGATVSGSTFKILQRGNGQSSRNAVINLDFSSVLQGLGSHQQISPDTIISIKHIDLGTLHGVPLGFTDAASPAPNQTWFLAAAEDSESTYHDGQNMGTAIGCLDPNDQLIFMTELPTAIKFEGLLIPRTGDARTFYVVSDADDPELPSELYQGTLPVLDHIRP